MRGAKKRVEMRQALKWLELFNVVLAGYDSSMLWKS